MEPENLKRPANLLSVTQAVQRIDRTVKSLSTILVEGEISSFRNNLASGHWYFDIKDSQSQLKCMMWSSINSRVNFYPVAGDKVWVAGELSVYPKSGELGLVVRRMVKAGEGALFAKFQLLVKKLRQEGLFNPELKRPIPKVPRTIGVITGLQTAALRDVIKRIKQYSPYVDMIIYPTPVQGDKAASEIVKQLDIASRRKDADVLLLVRGGGSLEDLWCFNEEIVARAIRRCQVPVITGIGHDSDQTIADFAADLSMPTPTAAASAAATPLEQLLLMIAKPLKEIHRMMEGKLELSQSSLAYSSRYFETPETFFSVFKNRFNMVSWTFVRNCEGIVSQRQQKLLLSISRLRQLSPVSMNQKLVSLVTSLSVSTHSSLNKKTQAVRLNLPPLKELINHKKEQNKALVERVRHLVLILRFQHKNKLEGLLTALKTRQGLENKKIVLKDVFLNFQITSQTDYKRQAGRFRVLPSSPLPSIKESRLTCGIVVSNLKKTQEKYLLLVRNKFSVQKKDFYLHRPGIQQEPIKRTMAALKVNQGLSLTIKVSTLNSLRKALDAYNPQRILKMGYALVKKDGKVVEKAAGLRAGEVLEIVFIDHEVSARVERDGAAGAK